MRSGNRSAFVALLGAGLLLGSPSRAADKELLDVLLGNGAITREQYAQLLEKEELRAEDLRDVKVRVDEQGLSVESGDGRFALDLGARMHADASGHQGNEASEATSGTELRRARIELSGRFLDDWLWAGEVDFADDEVSVKDFWVGYTGLPWGRFFVGSQKQPYSLGLEMSSNDIPFIERGVDNDLISLFVDRAVGFRAEFSGRRWFVASGFYGDGVEPGERGNEGWGQATRLVLAPLLDEDRVLHLGARGAFRSPSQVLQVRSQTTNFSNLFTVDTGALRDVERVFLVGPELALAVGPFSLSGEYNHAFLNRSRGGNLTFHSWHVEATWSITGESRAAAYEIEAGEFKRLQPARPFRFEGGGPGAWELAARYAAIDADDDDTRGGRQGVVTVGLNWHLNRVVRVMFDWSRILQTSSVNRDAEDLNVFQSRIQFAF